jgi:hypothetical protein
MVSNITKSLPRSPACNETGPIVTNIAFTLLALIKLPFHGLDESWTLLGIALLFDPFDPEVRWDKRPWYQRAWLVIHLVAMLVLGSLALLG